MPDQLTPNPQAPSDSLVSTQCIKASAVLSGLLISSIPEDIAKIFTVDVKLTPCRIVETIRNQHPRPQQMITACSEWERKLHVVPPASVTEFFAKHKSVRARMTAASYLHIKEESTNIDFIVKDITLHPVFQPMRQTWIGCPPETVKALKAAAQRVLDKQLLHTKGKISSTGPSHTRISETSAPISGRQYHYPSHTPPFRGIYNRSYISKRNSPPCSFHLRLKP